MTSAISSEAISPLRRRMIEDMSVRKFDEKTQHDYIRHVYIRHVGTFAKFLGRSPDTATGEDLRRYQVHQAGTGVQPLTMNSSAVALRFFFTVTLGRANLATQLTRVRYLRRLPRMLSLEDVGRLLTASSACAFGVRPAPATNSISPPSYKISRPWRFGCSGRRLNRPLRELRQWASAAAPSQRPGEGRHVRSKSKR